MRCLGLSGGYYHDAAACLFIDGHLVAFIEEERLTGRRYAENMLPSRCIAGCLEEAGITLGEIDVVALSWNPDYPEARTRLDASHASVQQLLPEDVFGPWNGLVVVIDHQRAHAAAAYRTSGFNHALVISADGSGDGKSLAVYEGRDGCLEEVETRDITQSLGWFYQRITTFLRLGAWQHSGKTMALAAYGEPCFTFPYLEVVPNEGFTFSFPRNILPPAGEVLRAEVRSRFYQKQKEYLWAHFQSLAGDWRPNVPRFSRDTGERLYEPPSQFACNLAASAQRVLEDALIALTKRHLARQGAPGICLAGGVMQNCKAIGRIASELPEGCGIYVSPVSGDSGGALGAALEAMWELDGDGRFPFTHAYWGPGFDDDEIEASLRRVGATFDRIADPAAVAAELVAANHVVGWFQGRMEVGARALGARSIVARPDSPVLRDRINAGVKNREPWRPFSPSVSDPRVVERFWRGARHASPFMAVALASVGGDDAIAGVTHIDGTSRVHLVRPEDNPRYARLIEGLGHVTGISMVLNTSFNGRDQPIVCTPLDALRTFYTTSLDAMVLGRCLIRKQASSGR